MGTSRVFLAVHFLLIAVAHVYGSVNGADSTLESVPDLEKVMYLNVESCPCVRLLNLSGEIGCSNPGTDKISAPIVRLKSSTSPLARPSTVLLLSEQMEDFFLRVSNDPEFSKNISGVLLKPSETVNMFSGFSPAEKFPQAAFAPYSNTSYEWNLPGSGIMLNRYDFPVFLLTKESSSTLKEIVSNINEGSRDNVAEFDLVMQIVFAAFTGEAWGYIGSRKFLQELDLGSDSVKGLGSSMIEQILEIGSVGKGLVESGTLFYAHAAGESTGTKGTLKALEDASESLGSDNVKVKKASTSNPGIPPSSLMTFLRKNASTSGVVLGDFDSHFTNKFYHSHLDNASNIKTSSVAAAAALVARALYILANGDATLDLMTLNDIRVNVSLVEELVGCLLTCEPGLSCELVRRYISPIYGDCPSHYVGVFQDTPSATEKPSHVDDTSRFLWNFLADMTSESRDGTGSCTGECGNVGDMCIGAEIEGGGKCVISTTRYVPAYSTRLRYENNIWHVLPPNPTDSMESVDPVWTESFWNTIGLRVYKVESALYDRLVLAGGVFVTFASYLAVVVTRTYLAKAIKRD